MLAYMQFVFEDSEVAGLQVSADAPHRLTVRFSAARVVEEAGRTGSGEGRWMRLLLICELDTQMDKGLDVSGRLEGGQVLLDGQRLRSLPLPHEIRQPLVLELDFASGAHCRVQGRALQLRPVAAQCATDSFQC